MAQSTLQGAIKAGQGIVVNVANGGHWVLVTGYAGGSTYLVNDPGRTVGSYPYTEMVLFSFSALFCLSCLHHLLLPRSWCGSLTLLVNCVYVCVVVVCRATSLCTAKKTGRCTDSCVFDPEPFVFFRPDCFSFPKQGATKENCPSFFPPESRSTTAARPPGDISSGPPFLFVFLLCSPPRPKPPLLCSFLPPFSLLFALSLRQR
jgi:hypothetical protein